VLFVGRLSPEKGADVLVRALAGSHVGLRIVGDGPARPELEELAATQRVAAEFTGWVAPSVVRPYMAEARLLCVPSVWYENCPGVVLEAMRDGLPVAASGLGGLTELLDAGRAGWLAPPGDPDGWREVIAKALDDPETAALVAERARQRVRARHDPDDFIVRIEGIYRSLLEPGHSS
jgi:glycosyltransferase involved in cell wall biosynthesis